MTSDSINNKPFFVQIPSVKNSAKLAKEVNRFSVCFRKTRSAFKLHSLMLLCVAAFTLKISAFVWENPKRNFL
ncbi:CLUMA_CG007458, isoform A [Clunio marinus]|uniref:CLUMA_CG007458, isoform A n=1 Tax=Clunio marinus TaxID=568069 RepID=A0A1J1I152_9DIPT|nr:CLUMA_CG007458, isoform A [Clunio marinus]